MASVARISSTISIVLTHVIIEAMSEAAVTAQIANTNPSASRMPSDILKEIIRWGFIRWFPK